MSTLTCKSIAAVIKPFEVSKKALPEFKVFLIHIPTYAENVSDFMGYLDDTEKHKAARYHSDKDAHRFIICRALLKGILAIQTHQRIENIHIAKDAHHKPFLKHHNSVHFNISHSQDYALIAIDSHEIGVDIEHVNSAFSFKEVLDYSFSKAEVGSVLDSDNQATTFYTYWTRKEAVVKATGQGMNDDMALLPVLDGLHHVNTDVLQGMHDITVLSFEIAPFYMAAIARKGIHKQESQLSVYTLPKSIEALKKRFEMN